MSKHIDFIFDGPPSPEAGRFVEVENESEESISIGEWIQRGDYWVLRVTQKQALEAFFDSRTVWLTMGNRDNTEGRGPSYIKNVCEMRETARRLGEKGYVQGGNCPVDESVAYRIGGHWYVPGQITSPTKDDERIQKRKDERDAVLKKAKELGLSDDEIKLL